MHTKNQKMSQKRQKADFLENQNRPQFFMISTKNRMTFKWVTLFFVVQGGFEPPQTEPKPVVLPLHHWTIAC